MTERQYSAKEWFNEAYVLSMTELKAKEEYALKLMPTDLAMDYSKDKIQNSGGGQEEKLLSWVMAMESVEKLRIRIDRIRCERIKVIEMVPDPRMRALLWERFINQKPWKAIQKVLNYSKTQTYNLYLESLDVAYDYIKEVDDEV